jgi:hypothetical protein
MNPGGVRQSLTFASSTVGEGDGVAIENEDLIRIEGVDDGEVLAFDLA